MIPTSNGTERKIVEAALRTLGRQGPENFSMASIGREAGISRRTLYRYFHNGDDVLQAVAVHVGDSYQSAIEAAVAADPAPERRVEVVLHATIHFGDYAPAAVAVMRMDPAFTLNFIEHTLEHYIEVLRQALAPATPHVPGLASGQVEVVELAELVIRLGVSGFSLRSQRESGVPASFARLISLSPSPERCNTAAKAGPRTSRRG